MLMPSRRKVLLCSCLLAALTRVGYRNRGCDIQYVMTWFISAGPASKLLKRPRGGLVCNSEGASRALSRYGVRSLRQGAI